MCAFQKVLERQPGYSSSRLRSLYSDFSPLKSSNIEGYNANVKFWQSLLEDCVSNSALPSNKHKLVLEYDDSLTHDVTLSKYASPLALRAVIVSELETFACC